MKRLAMAVVLICALSTSIFAGNMPTDGRSEPPPPTTSSTSGTSSTLLVSVILTILSLR
jgi:hypothetical protein